VDDEDETKSERTRAPSRTPFRSGQLLDDYIVGDVLGEGGMGIVFAARDPDLDRKVAIKVLRPEVFGGDDGLFAARARLLREAQAMAKLSHPNVITVYRIGVFEGHTFVAMEYVGGGTLRAWVAGKTHEQILDAYLAAAEGLAAAHAVGLVHRDFKPDNALVGLDGRVRVTDFGLVASERTDDDRDVRSLTLTQTGAILGTPAYMAPEQHEGLEADARADQFAFCVSLYEALYGERPFASPTLERLVANVMATRVTEPAVDNVPRHVRRTLLRGMARDPEQRFASLSEIVERLRPSAASRLSAIWDADRRRRIRDAFAAVPSARAKDTHARVEAVIDAWCDAWIERHAEHVRTLRERANAHETAAFLDRRLEELELTLAELERVDEENLDGTISLAAGLTPVDQLAHVVPLPAEPARRGEVAVLAARVQEVHTHLRFGRYLQGMELARAIEDAVERTDYAPLVAFHALARGRLHIALDERDLALRPLRRAVELAARAGEPAIEAAAATFMVQAVAHEPSRAEDMLPAARSAVERARLPLETARLEYVLAFNAQSRHDYEAARTHYERVFAIWEEAGAPLAFEMIFSGYANYGAALQTLGDLEGARAAYAKSREMLVASIGGDHPLVGDLETNLGACEESQNYFAQALVHHEAALAAYRRAYGERHARVAIAHYNIGDALVKLDRNDEALAHYTLAYDMRHSLFGDEHLATAESLGKLGMALCRDGRPADGLREIEAGLATRVKLLPAEHEWIAESRSFRAFALCMLERHADAIADYEYAARFYEQHDAHFWLALHAHSLGLIHLRFDDFAKAGVELERADRAWQLVDPKHPNAVETRFVLAQQQWEIGERARARELCASASALADDEGRAAIGKWLAAREGVA
jgi:tetratricopeptide (TPR) repeat protein